MERRTAVAEGEEMIGPIQFTITALVIYITCVYIAAILQRILDVLKEIAAKLR